MSTQDILRLIKNLPRHEQLLIAEQTLQALREDSTVRPASPTHTKGTVDVSKLRGVAKAADFTTLTKEQIREDYTQYLMEKYR